MKKKTNNHYISEFQLKYFRYRDPPRWAGKYAVWVYRAQSDANLCNVRGVASGHNFYGESDDALEDAFANLESLSGQAFSEISRDPARIEKHSQTLCNFVWVLSFRTRALRERIRHGIGTSIERMGQSSHSPEAIMRFRRSFDERLNQEVDERLEGLNVFERLAYKQTEEYKYKIKIANKYFEELIRSGRLSSMIKEGFEHVGGIFERSSAFADAHNKSLENVMTSGAECPDKLRPAKWTTVEAIDDYFVLGDAGVFSVNAEREVSPMIGGVSDWTEIYLPLSPKLAVCGLRHDGMPRLAVEEIRRFAIETSYEEFFASYYANDLTAEAGEMINKKGPIIGLEKIDTLVKEVWMGM